MSDITYRVRTSTGIQTIDPRAGHTLPHEHVLLDIRVWWEGEGHWAQQDPDEPFVERVLSQLARDPQAVTRENMVLSDWYLAAKELSAARQAGCQLMVDLTVAGLDPQWSLTARASRQAEISVVFGVGRYLHETLKPDDLAKDVSQLADVWTGQIEHGIDGQLPGIIGEIGTGPEISPAEMVSLQAAGRVAEQSGLPVNVHVHPYARQALNALRILDDAGADLSKVAVSHCDGELDIDWLVQVLQTGCYVEFDMFGTGPDRHVQGRGYPTDTERIGALAELVDQGWSAQLLLSHDICHRNSLMRYGGWGYGHIGRVIQPALESAIGTDQTYQLLAVNPLRLLHLEPGKTT